MLRLPPLLVSTFPYSEALIGTYWPDAVQLVIAEEMGMKPEELDKCVYEVSGESIFSYESLLVDGAQIGGLLWQSDNRDSDPESRVDAQELRQQQSEFLLSMLCIIWNPLKV